MAEEIGFENGRNSNFDGLVTLTLDPAIRHTVVHHSSTSTYIPNFIQIEETFCGRTDGRTYGRTDGHFPPVIILGRLLEVDLKNKQAHYTAHCKQFTGICTPRSRPFYFVQCSQCFCVFIVCMSVKVKVVDLYSTSTRNVSTAFRYSTHCQG